MNETLREQTEAFLNGATFLEDVIYAPAKTQLLMLADEIMALPASGALHSQYGLLYRFLLKERDNQADPADDLISKILAGETL